jgi:hypothetical protein
MAEEAVKEPDYFVYLDGHFTNLEAVARKIQGEIVMNGGEIHADEDASSSALAGFDLGAHVTDDMDEERLGQLLEEFDQAWRKVARAEAKEAGE